jgi:transcription initiation factor TFIID subunit 7
MSSPEDLIVVDDVGEHLGHATHSAGPSHAPTTSGMTTRRRTSAAASAIIGSSTERTTRSAAQKLKGQPTKLKLKLTDKASAQVAGMSFLGAYDRELDSSDEDLTFEEQFILRMPPGDDCERLRQAVSNREISNDVWFKFKGENARVTSSVLC